jgi:hypothetical protein
MTYHSRLESDRGPAAAQPKSLDLVLAVHLRDVDLDLSGKPM